MLMYLKIINYSKFKSRIVKIFNLQIFYPMCLALTLMSLKLYFY